MSSTALFVISKNWKLQDSKIPFNTGTDTQAAVHWYFCGAEGKRGILLGDRKARDTDPCNNVGES